MTSLEFHPLADLFPMLDEAQIEELAADIKANGLRSPVVTYEGKILDGRNRYRACQMAGIEPATREYAGPDALAYVLSINLRRRHLSPSQRAMVAAKAATLQRGRPEINASKEAYSASQSEAAKKLNVSRSAVQRARTVIDKGSPELAAKVERGELAVSAAARSLRESDDARARPEPPPRTPMQEKVDATMREQEARIGPIEAAAPLLEEQRKAIMPMRATATMWLRQIAAERIPLPATASALREALQAIEKALAATPTPTMEMNR